MDTEAAEGLRERKHRETRRRIADAGLRLFLDRGYDGTTVDAIAAEAGISRRTFFSYFKSKDEILATWHDDGWSGMLADLLMTSPDV
ncbi:MAG: TetR/AcrR family transcriptional regulator, partial [Vicinamibacterales bacterium]